MAEPLTLIRVCWKRVVVDYIKDIPEKLRLHTEAQPIELTASLFQKLWWNYRWFGFPHSSFSHTSDVSLKDRLGFFLSHNGCWFSHSSTKGKKKTTELQACIKFPPPETTNHCLISSGTIFHSWEHIQYMTEALLLSWASFPFIRHKSISRGIFKATQFRSRWRGNTQEIFFSPPSP